MPNVNLARKPSTDTTAGEASFRDAFPAGIVLPYAGSTAPDGWLLCDGAAINRTTYARLFAAISTTYGIGDGASTFNLPNTQGVFLRGAGSQTISSLTYTATRGTTQNDATAKKGLAATTSGTDGNHTHRIFTNASTTDRVNIGTGGSLPGWALVTNLSANTGAYNMFAPPNAWDGYDPAHGHAITVSGDTETRPANIGMNHIIKI